MAVLDYSLTIQTAPTEEPLTTAEAKAHLGIPSAVTDHDSHVDNLIEAARRQLETEARRAIVSQTWDMYLDAFPAESRIVVPKPPLQSVTYVKYLDTVGTEQTFSSSDYEVDTDREPGVIWLAYGASWPTIRSIQNAVRIRFVAGYGAQSAIDERIKQALLLMIGHWFQNREAVGPGTGHELPMAYRALVNQIAVAEYP